jgi:WD40 repeat protein
MFAGCGSDSPNQPGNTSGLVAPADLRASFVTSRQVRLDWRDQAADETGYEIYESVGNDSAFSQVLTTARDANSALLENRNAALRYFYKVRAFNQESVSLFSNIAETRGGFLAMTFGPLAEAPMLSVTYSPDGLTLATGSGEYLVHLWDVTTGRELRTLAGHLQPVEAVSFSPGGTQLLACADDGIDVWNLASYTTIARLSALRAKFTPDSRWLVSWNDSTRLLEPSDHRQRHVVYGPNDEFFFSADGHWMVSGGDSIRTFNLHDTTSWGIWAASKNVNYSGRLLDISPDAQYLVKRNTVVGSVSYYRISDMHEIWMLTGHSRHVIHAAISPDGKTLATASDDWSIKLWDLDAGQEKITLNGHTATVNQVAWSPSGRYLASVSSDRSAKTWGPFAE